MDLQKFGIKFFFKPNGSYPAREFIPEFHNWIQNNLVPEQLIIDVVDYSHILDGPGIMLIAHEGHFSLDHENNQPGLMYMRRTSQKGEFQQRFELVFDSTVQAAKLLSQNKIGQEIHYNSNTFRFITNDRLLAANNKENQEIFTNSVHNILEEKYPQSKWVFEDFSDEKERLAFSVTFKDKINLLNT